MGKRHWRGALGCPCQHGLHIHESFHKACVLYAACLLLCVAAYTQAEGGLGQSAGRGVRKLLNLA